MHFCENDQAFLPGWSDYARQCFAAFPNLGQLSLHGVTPTDDEAWIPKPGQLRFAQGIIFYEATENVGTSSIIPVHVFDKHGVRVHNLAPNAFPNFKLPDDCRLSVDIRALGYVCAWSDRYRVRNLGHELAEFERDRGYYEANYAAKPWVGVSGWRERVGSTTSRPRPVRKSLIFPGDELQAERSAGAVEDVSCQLWSMLDGYTAEAEVLDFLYVITRMTKPRLAVETGNWLGRSAVAIGRALRDNDSVG